MVTQKIIFTVKSINKNDRGDDKNTNIRVQDLEFAADGSNLKIVRIYFIMHDENQKSKLDTLEEQQTYELSFDDEEMRVNKAKGGSMNLNQASSFHSASKSASKEASAAGGSSNEVKSKKNPFVLVNGEDKEIRV